LSSTNSTSSTSTSAPKCARHRRTG
jgi:hypothetical protein